MRSIYAILLLAACSWPLHAQTWKMLDIDATGCTNIVVNPWEPGKLYFPHHGAIATTTDNGDSWEYINLSTFADMTPLSIHFDVERPDTWYLPVGYAGLAKTTDGGKTYALRNRGLDLRFEFREVVQDPKNPDILYILADGELCKSTDRGETWPQRLLAFNMFYEEGVSVFIDPNHTSTIRVFPRGELRLYESTDAGSNWIIRYLPNYHFWEALVTKDGAMWAGAAGSADSGKTWRVYRQFISGQKEVITGGCRVTYDAGRDRYIMALQNATMFEMQRGNSIWTEIDAHFDDRLHMSLTINALYHDDEKECLWVVYGDLIFLSEDNAMTFRHPRSGPFLGRSSIFATPSAHSDMIVTNSAYTNDNGASWVKCNGGAYDADYVFTFSSLDSNLFIAGGDMVYFTDKGLETFHHHGWERNIYPVLYTEYGTVKFNPHNPHQLCGGGHHGFWCVGDSIFRKPFGLFAPAEAPPREITYLTPLPPVHGPYITKDFAYHPHRDGVYYLATTEPFPDGSDYRTHIQFSEDFGASWKELYSELHSFAHEIIVHPERPDIIVVALGRGILRSSDGGTSWSKRPLPPDVTAYVQTLALDERFPHMMYAGMHGVIANNDDPTTGNRIGGICVSSDYGATWDMMPLDGLHNYTVNKIHYHENPRRLMISTSAGLYETRLPDHVLTAAAEADASSFALLSVYPTPVTVGQTATIRYSIPATGSVQFVLCDALGRRIQFMDAGQSPAGTFDLHFVPEVPSPGLYFLQMSSSQGTRTRKLIIRH